MTETYLIECPLAGESFANEDGTSRQNEIAICRKGELVALRWDRANPHDPAAVAVHSIRGVQIGFLRKGDNLELLAAVGEGRLVNAKISAIYGGSSAKPMLGVEIEVECLLDEPPVSDEGEEAEGGDITWAGCHGFWLLIH